MLSAVFIQNFPTKKITISRSRNVSGYDPTVFVTQVHYGNSDKAKRYACFGSYHKYAWAECGVLSWVLIHDT